MPDLILLKLYAGGSTDLRDVEELLRVTDRAVAAAAVGQEIGRLPPEAQREWSRIVASGRGG